MERPLQPLLHGIDSSVPPSLPDLAPVRLPLSYGQRALWFVQSLNPTSVGHNVTHAGRLHGEIDPDLVRTAFQKVVSRHPVLRSTFHQHSGEPRQFVHTEGTLGFACHDASTWSSRELQEAMRGEMYRPFDLEHGPLLRATLYQESPTSHVLLLCLHHIVTDMWSCALLLHEFSLFYVSEKNGTPHEELPSVDDECTAFASRESEILSGPRGEELWHFWEEYLRGDLPTVVLQPDHMQTSGSSHRGSTVTVRLPESLTRNLRQLSSAQGARLDLTILAGYAAFLAKYTGNSELLIGTPKAVRNRAFAWMMGYFINPIVLRIDLQGDPPFAELLQRVKKSALAAYAHAEFPFPLLVNRLQPTRNLAQAPLFRVMFSWQKTFGIIQNSGMTAIALNENGTPFTLNGIPASSMTVHDLAVPFDLTLMAAEASGGEVALTFEYDTSLFERSTVERMLHHLTTLMQEVVSAPGSSLARIPLLSEAEREEMISSWVRPIPALPDVDPVYCWVERAARKQPTSCAVVWSSGSMTYGELNKRADQLAHQLQSSGIGPESMVACMLERSPEAMIAMLGILKSGGVFVPIDPTFPDERVRYILNDARVKCVITRQKFRDRFPDGEVGIVYIDGIGETTVGAGSETRRVRLSAENTAYVIYTSGSTGLPKGVVITHGALAAHCASMQEYYQIDPRDRVLQFASLNFDASLEQIFSTWMAGATLVLRDALLWAPKEFIRRMEEYRLSVINLPPAYWHQIAEAWSEYPASADDSSLRLVIIGGDRLYEASVAVWRRTPGGAARLLNAYGPTETTITAVTYEVPQTTPQEGVAPIGRPLQHRLAYVLDQSLAPLPPGVPGELYLGGRGLARGYLHQPSLTAERFLPDPFAAEPGSRMYRTGDVVLARGDGVLRFLSRTDHQVKVRGFRVELEEIEVALSAHPGLAEVAVAVFDDRGGEKSLAAYVVTRKADIPTDDEIFAYLGRHLPAYMVPNVIIRLESLPHTVGGKVDRSALPIPQPTRDASALPDDPPRSRIELQIADIWKSLLNVEAVGVHESFFRLGGHSLLLTQLAANISEVFRVEVSLQKLVDSPTIAQQTRMIEDALIEAGGEEEVSEILEEIQGLSDAEIQELMENEQTERKSNANAKDPRG